jgi:elongation factor 1-beta
MKQLIARIRINPAEAEWTPQRLVERLHPSLGSVELRRFWEEPIAFGVKALVIEVVMPDEEGAMDGLERRISELPEVGSLQVLGVGRLSTNV